MSSWLDTLSTLECTTVGSFEHDQLHLSLLHQASSHRRLARLGHIAEVILLTGTSPKLVGSEDRNCAAKNQ